MSDNLVGVERGDVFQLIDFLDSWGCPAAEGLHPPGAERRPS